MLNGGSTLRLSTSSPRGSDHGFPKLGTSSSGISASRLACSSEELAHRQRTHALVGSRTQEQSESSSAFTSATPVTRPDGVQAIQNVACARLIISYLPFIIAQRRPRTARRDAVRRPAVHLPAEENATPRASVPKRLRESARVATRAPPALPAMIFLLSTPASAAPCSCREQSILAGRESKYRGRLKVAEHDGNTPLSCSRRWLYAIFAAAWQRSGRRQGAKALCGGVTSWLSVSGASSAFPRSILVTAPRGCEEPGLP